MVERHYLENSLLYNFQQPCCFSPWSRYPGVRSCGAFLSIMFCNTTAKFCISGAFINLDGNFFTEVHTVKLLDIPPHHLAKKTKFWQNISKKANSIYYGIVTYWIICFMISVVQTFPIHWLFMLMLCTIVNCNNGSNCMDQSIKIIRHWPFLLSGLFAQWSEKWDCVYKSTILKGSSIKFRPLHWC